LLSLAQYRNKPDIPGAHRPNESTVFCIPLRLSFDLFSQLAGTTQRSLKDHLGAPL
jgi:hypothetical protein